MAADILGLTLQGAILALAMASMAVALHVRDLVRAIGAFALASALVAMEFYLLGAPFASVLELTVGAGLVSVLFLIAITLAGGREEAMA